MDLQNDPNARFQVLKQDIDDLKTEVRESNKKLDMLVQAFGNTKKDSYNNNV